MKKVMGLPYCGFQMDLEGGFTLEAFSTSARSDEYSELWRFFDRQSPDRHFVVAGYGIQGENEPLDE